MTRRSRPQPRVDAYVAVITIAGAILIGGSRARSAVDAQRAEWGILAGLALIASRFPLRLPGSNAWFSISDTFYMTSALLFGPGPATVTIAIDSMLMSHSFRTWQARRFLFNSGAPTIAFWAGAPGVLLALRVDAVVRHRTRRWTAWSCRWPRFALVYYRPEFRADRRRAGA